MKHYLPEISLFLAAIVFVFTIFLYDVSESIQTVELPAGKTLDSSKYRILKTETIHKNGMTVQKIVYLFR